MLNRGNNCFDHEVGSLEPEKLADFVVLDKDPLTVEVDKIKKIRVLETWMDGTKVFKASHRSSQDLLWPCRSSTAALTRTVPMPSTRMASTSAVVLPNCSILHHFSQYPALE